MSQTMVAKGVLQAMVPPITAWLENHIEVVKKRNRNASEALAEFSKIAPWIDAATMAHIALSVTLDCVGRGNTFKTPINSIQMHIGRQVEDQAFISYMEDCDPFYFKKLQKFYLHDPVRTYEKKIYAMKFTHEKTEGMDWKWMSEESLVRLGAFLLKAVISIPFSGEKEGMFESRCVRQSKKKAVNFLGYSKVGIRYRDLLQGMCDNNLYRPEPMVCPPLPWSLTERGGYLTPPPRPFGNVIHDNKGTIPSETAFEALNRLQSQPYNVNNYILDVELKLGEVTQDIGTFRTYEKDSWVEEHMPIVDSEWLETLEKDSKDYKDTMRMLMKCYHQQKLDEDVSSTTRRVLTTASTLRDETFWTPWFFDSRLRLYPQSELSITGGDYIRALLVTANPKPITEDTKRELLIAIATSGGFDKVDKKDYFTRYEWALNFVESEEFKAMVEEPLSVRKWQDADEPFQFLSYCEEFYSIFITGERTTTRVWVGRDMTCSGIQILSCLIGDEKAMFFTNVTVSETVQDAYGEVARCARELIQTPGWKKVQIEKINENNERWNANHPDVEPRKTYKDITIPLEEIDRSIAKKPVMLTGYGGTYLTKRGHIIDELRKRKLDLTYEQMGIIVKALIDGMELAFPDYTQLNKWFKQVAREACKVGVDQLRWVTPNGSVISQDYREPLFTRVSTHAATGGNYARLIRDENGTSSIQHGWGDVKSEKHQSAVAANFTHALDATIIQNGVSNLPEDIDVVTVHDCCFLQPGYLSNMQSFRNAFYGVVTTPVLENLLEESGLESVVGMLPRKDVELEEAKESPYMFS